MLPVIPYDLSCVQMLLQDPHPRQLLRLSVSKPVIVCARDLILPKLQHKLQGIIKCSSFRMSY